MARGQEQVEGEWAKDDMLVPVLQVGTLDEIRKEVLYFSSAQSRPGADGSLLLARKVDPVLADKCAKRKVDRGRGL